MAKKAARKVETPPEQPTEAQMVDNLPATYAPSIVAPIIGSKEVVLALRNYQELQKALDQSMPDQLIEIRGRHFRKKGYWRAIRTAFNLNLECVKEERIEVINTSDWGYAVNYKATAPNGASAEGDGCCMASEKTDRQGNVIATEHNVRSHAHTRAFNRAVSNLVGFGEVSAEEMENEYDQRPQQERKQSAWSTPSAQSTQPKQEQAAAQQPTAPKLSKYHIELKQWIEDFVRDNELGENDKAAILLELTAFQPKKGGPPFHGIPNFNFEHPHFTEKLAMMGHHNFKERKAAAEAQLAKRGKK